MTNKFGSLADDTYGHGTHVESVLMGSQKADDGSNTWMGIAPDAGLVAVQAFDGTGSATYANVLRGMNWILENRVRYGIRVLNCSFTAPARSRYWDDPDQSGRHEALAGGHRRRRLGRERGTRAP